MPVYGKGRILRANPKHPIREAHARESEKAKGKSRRVVLQRTGQWSVFFTPIQKISTELGLDIPRWIERRLENKRKLNILDWGCGAGTAATQLGEKYGRFIHMYGYGNMPHESWAKNAHVKFIWQDQQSMLRYFKDGSLDLIYSRFGLYHTLRPQIPLEERMEYWVSLVKKLSTKGLLISDLMDRPFPRSMIIRIQHEVPNAHVELRAGTVWIARSK